MSRDFPGREHAPHRASHEAEPLKTRAPRATKHLREQADDSPHKRGRKRVHESARVTAAEHQLKAHKDHRKREIADVQGAINFGWAETPSGMNGNERGKEKGSAPEGNEPAHSDGVASRSSARFPQSEGSNLICLWD